MTARCGIAISCLALLRPAIKLKVAGISGMIAYGIFSAKSPVQSAMDLTAILPAGISKSGGKMLSLLHPLAWMPTGCLCAGLELSMMREH